MYRVIGETFENRRIPIDGALYEHCKFVDCKLNFRASDTVGFEHCTFISCEWVFEGAALLMLQFMAELYDGLGMDGQELVKAIFASVQEGQLGEKLFHPEPATAA